MATLLIDNSNSRTKFALSNNNNILLPWRHTIETSDLTANSIDDFLKGIHYTKAVICSVVPEKLELLQATLDSPVHNISSKSEMNIGISYPRPEEVGADRLANGAAAFDKYGAPTIVIDSGTAVTFDVIEHPNLYAGGVIAPGLNLLTNYFAEKTALLPKIDLYEPKSYIGKSTTEAMNIGAIAGFRGLIREILAGLIDELPDNPKVVATGGDASLLFKGIEEIDCVDPNLTLEGVMKIGEMNPN